MLRTKRFSNELVLPLAAPSAPVIEPSTFQRYTPTGGSPVMLTSTGTSAAADGGAGSQSDFGGVSVVKTVSRGGGSSKVISSCGCSSTSATSAAVAWNGVGAGS